MISAAELLIELQHRGIRIRADGDKVCLSPANAVMPELVEAIRTRKLDLLALLREQAEIDRIARLDAERREADRQAKRGYDFDPSAPSHIEREEAEIDRLARGDGWQPNPAESIVATCQRYGVALRINSDGTLVVGKAGAKAEEATQPWPNLLVAVQANLEAVAALVASGWSLQAEFPERGAA